MRGSGALTSVNKAVGLLLFLPFLLLLLAGCDGKASGMILATPSPLGKPLQLGATPTPTVEAKPTVTPTPTRTPTPTPAPTPALPQRMTIPDIKVDAEMVEVGLEKDGTMAAPKTPDVVGWFGVGPRPGQVGNVLASGHLDWAGPPPRAAVFWRLKELVPGNVVLVNDSNKQYKYVVSESLRYEWDDPEALKHLSPSSAPILTLITCEGVFYQATQNYTHRRIVVAELESSILLGETEGASSR